MPRKLSEILKQDQINVLAQEIVRNSLMMFIKIFKKTIALAKSAYHILRCLKNTHKGDNSFALMLVNKSKLSILWLALVSFFEAIIILLPPDIPLLTLSSAHPQHYIKYFLIASIASIMGGLCGYMIGYIYSDFALELVAKWGYADKIDYMRVMNEQYGVLIVFIFGFTPLPYKILTLVCGVFKLDLELFILGSLLGRGLRFWLVAFIGVKFGARMWSKYKKYEIYVLLFLLVLTVYGIYEGIYVISTN